MMWKGGDACVARTSPTSTNRADGNNRRRKRPQRPPIARIATTGDASVPTTHPSNPRPYGSSPVIFFRFIIASAPDRHSHEADAINRAPTVACFFTPLDYGQLWLYCVY